jgi:hypothetical protein
MTGISASAVSGRIKGRTARATLEFWCIRPGLCVDVELSAAEELATWAKQDSNLRHPRCKRGALPLSYSPERDPG